MHLNVNELFYSIQGETLHSGLPSFFVRLAGCNLDCSWCDTRYARSECVSMPVRDIVNAASHHEGLDHITITGGEPLLQENTLILMEMLLERNFAVQVETNGSIGLHRVPAGVRRIVDIKTPSSGEVGSFLMENLNYIVKNDEIKFVISDSADYAYSRAFIKNYLEKKECIVNFSPVHGTMPVRELAEAILSDRLRVRLNLQLHRIIWPDGEPKI